MAKNSICTHIPVKCHQWLPDGLALHFSTTAVMVSKTICGPTAGPPVRPSSGLASLSSLASLEASMSSNGRPPGIAGSVSPTGGRYSRYGTCWPSIWTIWIYMGPLGPWSIWMQWWSLLVGKVCLLFVKKQNYFEVCLETFLARHRCHGASCLLDDGLVGIDLLLPLGWANAQLHGHAFPKQQPFHSNGQHLLAFGPHVQP